LLAAPDLLAPEPLADASAAPPLYVELLYTHAAPVACAPATVTAESTLPVSLEHKFRHKKGPDVIDALINASLEVRVCNSQTKAVLATAVVDLLPFGLGSIEIQDGSLPLQPTDTREPFKVNKCLACQQAGAGDMHSLSAASLQGYQSIGLCLGFNQKCDSWQFCLRHWV
jgi:hypothetical protein